MINSAKAGYGQMRRQTASPRAVESQILLEIASDIENCDAETISGYKALATAVKRNTDLWTLFVADLASEQNELPQDLKQNLVKLAAFAISYGPKVLNKTSDPAPLVKINRMMADSLREKTQVAA